MTGQPTKEFFRQNGHSVDVAATRTLQDALDDCLIEVADWEFADAKDATVDELVLVTGAWFEVNQPAQRRRSWRRRRRGDAEPWGGVSLRWKLARSRRQPFVFLRSLAFVAAVVGSAVGLEYILFLRV